MDLTKHEDHIYHDDAHVLRARHVLRVHRVHVHPSPFNKSALFKDDSNDNVLFLSFTAFAIF